jgi:hypothetical protein
MPSYCAPRLPRLQRQLKRLCPICFFPDKVELLVRRRSATPGNDRLELTLSVNEEESVFLGAFFERYCGFSRGAAGALLTVTRFSALLGGLACSNWSALHNSRPMLALRIVETRVCQLSSAYASKRRCQHFPSNAKLSPRENDCLFLQCSGRRVSRLTLAITPRRCEMSCADEPPCP